MFRHRNRFLKCRKKSWRVFTNRPLRRVSKMVKNQVFAELTVLQERFASAMSNLAAVGQELASRNQVQLMSLACIIAEKLVRHEVSVRPKLLLDLIANVLSEQAVHDDVVIQCSPGDYEYIAENRASLVDGVDGAFSIRVEQNPEFEYGDFNIETRTGSVDGTVASRMRDIESSLNGGQMFDVSRFGVDLNQLADRLDSGSELQEFRKDHTSRRPGCRGFCTRCKRGVDV